MSDHDRAGIRIRASMCLTRATDMLFVEHAKQSRHYWLLPGGGVELGETIAEAARREVLEETGYVTIVGALQVVCEAIEPGGRHILNMVFAGTVIGGVLVPGLDGVVVDAAWHSRESLESLEMYPHIGRTLADCWSENFSGPARFLGNVWREPRPT